MGYINFNVDSVSMSEVLKMFEFVENIPEKATYALTAGAEAMLPYAKALSPVREGNMKRDLKVGRKKKSGKRSSVEVGVFYPDSPYAHLVEGGHGGPKAAPAHPFLEPAAEMSEAEVIDAIMDVLTNGL